MLKYLLPAAILAPISGCNAPQAAQAECFVVVTPTNTQPVRYNKCTGESWLLIREISSPKTPTSPEIFTYRWAPLQADYSEPQLSY